MKFYSLFFCLICQSAHATLFPSPIGGKSLAMSGIYASLDDPFTAFNHPGILSEINKNSLAVYYQNQFYVEGLNHLGLCIHKADSSRHVYGLSMGFMGNRYYNESIIKGGYAIKLSPNLGAGISLDYLRLQFPEGQRNQIHKLTFEVGLNLQIQKSLRAAIKVFNPTRTGISKDIDERFPMLVSSALILESNKHFHFYLEWNQIMNRHGNYHLAMSYQWKQQLSFFVGVSATPMQFGLGLHFEKNKYSVSLAFLSHPYLKNNSAAGMAFYPGLF